MNIRFSEPTKMLLVEWINCNVERPIHTDGEAQIRTFIKLKRENKLFDLIFSDNKLNLENKWVNLLIEDFIITNEGTYGGTDIENKREIVNFLQKTNKLYILFEGHYSYDETLLL